VKYKAKRGIRGKPLVSISFLAGEICLHCAVLLRGHLGNQGQGCTALAVRLLAVRCSMGRGDGPVMLPVADWGRAWG